ncbi:oxygen-independent coproporphyrinogen III oxidase [Erythrobacter sanguineus]|jgi:oxygen-independent coproporphyrinogen III oxidase|uniref:Coproporphyrinogen-III oxidase n=1 Tax=Erythrobacter sanguineus TaxID=198312 RepID=A0A1M7SCT3_9SPHN|nr:oxygen-independent coproporphyrinogen III oxidase [Erythrobacter sanguineus]SHN56291.1 oxygen-independent coproporphyrinogen-3 oxidase [Erythrobacter sanguineus]
MWTYHPELLATPVPRYTSYPTAADFGAIEEGVIERAIAGADGDVSLYLHIPFCEKICYYCGCNTGASGKRARVETYLAALHQELATVASLLPASARVRRIAFGGGSPNAIAPHEFMALVDALHAHFPLFDPEWSIELDPRSLTAEWGHLIREVGITRASMGVQTFAPHCQTAIGREQPVAMICRSIDWLRSGGVTSLNFDLMYGLPHQTDIDLADSLEHTRMLGAERVAVFGYAHVPHLVPRQTMIPESTLPGGEARFAMAAQAHEFLDRAGYEAIGFDHFALPHDPMAQATRAGTLRRNFQGFTDDPSEVLIGMGSSAISGFPGLIAQNEKHNGRYRALSAAGRLSASHGIARSPEDRLRGGVIEALLCRGEAQLSPCLIAEVRERLAPFTQAGLATLSGNILRILPDGLPYARVIAAMFDSYRAVTQRRFSSAI